MYVNSGYLNNTKAPLVDDSQPLIVGGCGTYRLKTKPKLSTWRPYGRLIISYCMWRQERPIFSLEEKSKL